MSLTNENETHHEVIKRSPRRYHFFAGSRSNSLLTLKHSFDIREKITLETLTQLAELTIQKFRELLNALDRDSADVDPQALFIECIVCYLTLLSDLQQFLDEGIEVPETEHRHIQKHNVRKAKVDYYFNWDKRLIAKAQTVSESDTINAFATIGAAIAMAVPMVLNFLITLAPIERAFNDKDSSETITQHQARCLEQKATGIDGIDTTAIHSLSVST